MSKLRIGALILSVIMTLTVVTSCGGSDEPSSSVDTGNVSSEDVSSEDGDEVMSDLLGGASSDAAESDTSSTSTGATSSKKPSGNNNNNTPKPPTVSKNPEDEKATMPKYDIKDKKISVCIDWDPKSAWVQRWVEAFNNAYPGFTISWKQSSPQMKASKLAVWKNSNTSPDIIYIKPEESFPTLMNKKLVQPVDGYIKINDALWGSTREIMNSMKLDGKNYQIVTTADLMGGIVYKKDVMKNAGLPDPEALLYENKWTWSAFEKAAEKLTKINASDESKSRYGVHFHYAEPFIHTTGKDLIEYKNGKWISNLKHKSVIEAVSFLEKMGPTGKKYALTSESEMTTLRSMTVKGQIGMYVTAESPGLEFPNEIKNGTLSYVPFPRYDKSNTHYAAAQVDGWCVPEGAKNPMGGVAFATAVRGMQIGLVKIKDTGEVTEAQKKVNEYAKSKIVGVPEQFRRLQGTFEYYNVYGPTFLGGESYSGVVEKIEPQIMEALKKE